MKESRNEAPTRGALFALLAAALFGASAPVVKLLLRDAQPLMLSGILYLGAALALTAFRLVRPASAEARLRRADLPLLSMMIVFGGILGPLLLLRGLDRVSGIAGSLLLNLEAAFTAAIAIVFFHEHLSWREVAGLGVVLGGAAVLGGAGDPSHADLLGAASIAGACFCWAIDNNASQRLSVRDPVALGRAKSAIAGAASLAVALAFREKLPSARVVAAGAVVGALGYGASVAFFVASLRDLGAARQSALFASAPFVGALVAIPVLHRSPNALEVGAGAVMACGLAFVLLARHSHRHRHEPLAHDHAHVHDEHHQHSHDGPITEPHAHPHQHDSLEHEHRHVSDVHHRHSHD